MARERVELRTPDEIERIREASLIVHDILREAVAMAEPGVTTADIDRLAESRTLERRAKPAFKGYHGFPASICISVNDEVVHGIPSPRRVLRDGDVVGLDFGVQYRGYFGDSACSVAVGRPSERAQRLLDVTREALARAIAAASPRHRLGDVGAAVQDYVEAQGFSVVRDFVGHGIGRRLHEPPPVPNFGTAGTGLRLRPGMVLALEPMVTAGRPEVRTLDDGWTAVSADGSLAAHFEHTVAITEDGAEILSLPEARGTSGK
jgi:methionyl aminopeptidase